MPEYTRDDKTEQPTSRRREDARAKGQVAKSVEVTSTAILMMSLLYFIVMGPSSLRRFGELFAYLTSHIQHIEITPDTISPVLRVLLGQFFGLLLPFLLYIVVVAVTANLAQIGWLWSSELLRPKFTHFNVLQGLKRMLISGDTLIKLVFSLAKVLLIGWIVYAALKPSFMGFLYMVDHSSIISSCLFSIGVTRTILTRIVLALAAIAALDFYYQHHKQETNLRMTKQEVKEEMKNVDIDPRVRAKIRAKQMEMSRRRMMSAVPTADVVITNPTTYAVAIKYDVEEMNAPVVVAKGARLIAARIKDLARKNGVPVVENKELARDLYRHVEIGMPVPLRLYKAVAQVLAYVYTLRQGRTA